MILQHNFLDIDVDEINQHPIRFDIDLSGQTFALEFSYNEYADCYYCTIYDAYDVMLVASEKIVYGMNLFQDITDPRLPVEPLVPLDESDRHHEVNKSTFGKYVFLVFNDDLNPSDDDNVNADAGDGET